MITVFSVYTTPISPYYGNDSAFFLLMGKGVTQGKIPYLDLYDQKGPMIFYVNALGYLLTGDRYGIFLMQIVNLTAACLIVYRLARFWLRSGASLAVVAAYLFVYVGTVQDGNMTEEWIPALLAAADVSLAAVSQKRRERERATPNGTVSYTAYASACC